MDEQISLLWKKVFSLPSITTRSIKIAYFYVGTNIIIRHVLKLIFSMVCVDIRKNETGDWIKNQNAIGEWKFGYQLL